MTDSFEKLKKKCLLAAIVKSVAAGVSAGLLVSGIFLLSFGLAEISLNPAVYVVSALVPAAIAGGLCYFFMHPTDKKVAKKYDNKLNLNERLQTMVAFAGQEGDVIALQREDAAEKLAGVKVNAFDIKRLWYYVVVAVVALAMFFTGIFVPAAAQTAIPDDPPIDIPEDENAFDYDIYMQAAMAELIVNVTESDLTEAIKQSYLSELTALDTNLKEITVKTLMQSTVLGTVARIDAVTSEENSFRAICAGLDGNADVLADAIRESVAVYSTSPTELSDYQRVKAFATRLSDSIDIIFELRILPTVNYLKIPNGGTADADTGEIKTLQGELTALAGYIGTALSASEVDTGDNLYTALNEFVKKLNDISAMAGKFSDNTLFTTIDTAYAELKANLNSALTVQCYNCLMNMFVREKLAGIFGISVSSLPSFNEDLKEFTGSGSSSGGNDIGTVKCDCANHDECKEKNCDCGCLNNSSGGFGGLDDLYGSDDVIYDPDLDDYVKYGEVLIKYYERVYDRILEGSLSEEVQRIIEEYFTILNSGIKNDSSADE